VGELAPAGIESWVESVRRIFARTMWRDAHEHALPREQDHGTFVAAAEQIRGHGYEARFDGRAYVQHDVGAYFIWTRDNRIAPTIVINRTFRSPGAPARLRHREMGKQGPLGNRAQPALFDGEEKG
jgi:hypothetical protein